MAYVVVTGSERKEFEYLKEALAYTSEQSRVYEQDAFGNMRPINPEEWQSITDKEPTLESKKVEPQPTAEQALNLQSPNQPAPGAFTEMNAKMGVKIGTATEKKKSDYGIVKMVLLIIFGLLLIIVLIAVLQPFMNEVNTLEEFI